LAINQLIPKFLALKAIQLEVE